MIRLSNPHGSQAFALANEDISQLLQSARYVNLSLMMLWLDFWDALRLRRWLWHGSPACVLNIAAFMTESVMKAWSGLQPLHGGSFSRWPQSKLTNFVTDFSLMVAFLGLGSQVSDPFWHCYIAGKDYVSQDCHWRRHARTFGHCRFLWLHPSIELLSCTVHCMMCRTFSDELALRSSAISEAISWFLYIEGGAKLPPGKEHWALGSCWVPSFHPLREDHLWTCLLQKVRSATFPVRKNFADLIPRKDACELQFQFRSARLISEKGFYHYSNWKTRDCIPFMHKNRGSWFSVNVHSELDPCKSVVSLFLLLQLRGFLLIGPE